MHSARGGAWHRTGNGHGTIELEDLKLAIHHTVDARFGNAKTLLPAAGLWSTKRDRTLALTMAALGAATAYQPPLSGQAVKHMAQAGLSEANLDTLLEDTFRDQFRADCARIMPSMPSPPAAATDDANGFPRSVEAPPPLTRTLALDAATRVRTDLEAAFLDPGHLIPRLATALMETSGTLYKPTLRKAL